ncbi:uncharacterized protein C8A04DRAFT_29821 [Dichotomopilus funicola]|uniref:F-box domain-containing protein n=1 Tax=Dichotomopilus funicola TaxID=1934379 RepID=A0AAN6V0N7_9PEZI|nr:hypothetical protein C8A04DRAFT_29821 [Dichotomopilus funicola]
MTSKVSAVPEPGPSIASGHSIEPTTGSSEATHQKNDPMSSANASPEPMQATNSALEGLPAEIRRIILEELDYPSLLTLAHTSPVFYQSYRLHQTPLLRACLQKALGVTIADASAAYRSSPGVFAQERNKDEITKFLATAWGGPPNELTESEVREVSRLHFTVMEPLLERFMTWSLNHFSTLEATAKPPSITERGRIMRAMYRFSTGYNLFYGYNRYDPSPIALEDFDIISLFLFLFEPWEVEQIVSVDCWVRQELDSLEEVYSGEQRRIEQPSERDLRAEAREPLPFVGDLEPDSFESKPSPPLGWTWVCEGVYYNGYGDRLGREMRQIAWVMWDEGRFRKQMAEYGDEI